MCGIVGFVGQPRNNLARELLDRLATLEYRGYDSAGVLVADARRGWNLHKAVGGLQKLRDRLPPEPARGHLGFAHTRWATHGVPSERNALPIASADGRAWIVFNGIVENDLELRRQLQAEGISFATDNDAETLLYWILRHADWKAALQEVQGRFAFCLVRADKPNMIRAARRGSPLVIGTNTDGYSIASDIIALPANTSLLHIMDDESFVELRTDGLTVWKGDQPVEPRFQSMPDVSTAVLDAGFSTFTEQEMMRQPETLAATVAAAVQVQPRLHTLMEGVDQVILTGCGSAFHAASLGEQLIQEYAGIFAKAMIASELRVSHQPLNPRTLVVAISQSGETADTLASLERAKSRGAPTIVISNAPNSSMARVGDLLLPLHCGPEVGVASTKAYTSMLVQVAFLALAIGKTNDWESHVRAARRLPQQVECILAERSRIERMARTLRERRNFLFVGRDRFLPTAYEGALKLRELSYRHAEGIGAGELKHGTLALIETQYPVIAIAPRGSLHAKMVSSIQEIRARGGQVWGIVSEGDRDMELLCHETIALPETLPAFQPILATIPLQIFAYEMARTLGRNIDRPRNLAKSVTVE